MHVTVNSQLLAAELRLLNKIVPTKPAIAILGYVLLSASDALRFYATDLEVGLSTGCDARVTMSGKVALPMAKFLALVEQFPDDDVMIALDKGQVMVACGAFKSRLQTLPVDNFPPPQAVEGESVVLDANALRQLIARTRYAVSATNSKHVLKGALLTMTGQVAAMAATDAKRLALATMACTGTEQRIIVPAKTLDMLAAGTGDGDVELTVGARHLFFAIDDRVLMSRTIDGEFPKYERIIPRSAENDKVITIDRAALTAALRRVALISEESQVVCFNVSTNAIELTAASAEVGSAVEEVTAEYGGTPTKIRINGAYVLDFLNASSERTITLTLNENAKAALFTDGVDHLAVVMLLR